MNRVRLTANFFLHEFEHSTNALRLGIDNRVPKELMDNALRVASKMQEIRAILGNRVITVTSGYRCPELNAATPGSSQTSAHMRMLASDFIVEGLSPMQVCKILEPHVKRLGIDQLILEFGGWTHVGLRDGAPRNQVFSYVKRGGKTVKLDGLVL